MRILIILGLLLMTAFSQAQENNCIRAIEQTKKDLDQKQNYCDDVLSLGVPYYGKLWAVDAAGKFKRLKDNINGEVDTVNFKKGFKSFVSYNYGDNKATFTSSTFEKGEKIGGPKQEAEVIYDENKIVKEVRFNIHTYVLNNVNGKCFVSEQKQGRGNNEFTVTSFGFCHDFLNYEKQGVFTCSAAYPTDIEMNPKKCADAKLNNDILKLFKKHGINYKKIFFAKNSDVSQKEITELCSGPHYGRSPVGRAINMLALCMHDEKVNTKVLAELATSNNQKTHTATGPAQVTK